MGDLAKFAGGLSTNRFGRAVFADQMWKLKFKLGVFTSQSIIFSIREGRIVIKII